MAGRGRLHHGRCTEVVPTEWGVAHRPTVDGAKTGATCTLRVPGVARQEWSEADQEMVAVPYQPYATDVPCQLITLTGSDQHPADDPEVVAEMLVTFPIGFEATVGHIVTVTTPDAVVVLEAVYAEDRTHAWERVLWCTRTT